MIGERVSGWMDRQPTDVLVRLEAVDPEKWSPWIPDYTTADGWGDPGAGCLFCHGFDCQKHEDYMAQFVVDGTWSDAVHRVELHYLKLSTRFGDARVGRAISARARRILEERRRQERTSTDADRGKAASGLDRSAPAIVPTRVTASLLARGEPLEVGA